MKVAVVLVLVAMMAVALISGCTQQAGPSGELTGAQMEEEAYKAVEQDMGTLDDMTMEDLESELLSQ
jgi:outer membrane lipoprotein-sorting protein